MHLDLLSLFFERNEFLEPPLNKINTQLLAATAHTCSQYGDRILETMQHKLFYLKHVLQNNTNTLNKHKNVLNEFMNGSSTKSKKELEDYHNFCEESATYIRSKIANYKSVAQKFIQNNCGN